MRPVPESERWFPALPAQPVANKSESTPAASSSEAGPSSPPPEVNGGPSTGIPTVMTSVTPDLLASHVAFARIAQSQEARVERLDAAEPFRKVRCGPLRDLLDEEFNRNYRFEGISDFFHDLKGLFRKVVVREQEQEFGELFPANSDPRRRRKPA